MKHYYKLQALNPRYRQPAQSQLALQLILRSFYKAEFS